MGRPVPKDANGIQIQIGDLVCYTTNSRDSGLGFGRVATIKETPTTISVINHITQQWDRVPSLSFRISVQLTDPRGNPRIAKRYDTATGRYEDYEVTSRSGQIIHAPHKFLIL